MEKLQLTDELISKFQTGAVSIEDIVNAFNPENASSLPEAIVQFMPHLTGEQIAAIASAYPNKATNNSYLILKDTAKDEKTQLFPRSTWANLASLRKVGGNSAKTMVALTFTSLFNQRPKEIITAPLQDISKASLPGITTAPLQNAEQTEVAQTGAGQGAALTVAGEQTAATGAKLAEGAKNANSNENEFPDITIDEIKKDQAAAAAETKTVVQGSENSDIKADQTKSVENADTAKTTGAGTTKAKGAGK